MTGRLEDDFKRELQGYLKRGKLEDGFSKGKLKTDLKEKKN